MGEARLGLSDPAQPCACILGSVWLCPCLWFGRRCVSVGGRALAAQGAVHGLSCEKGCAGGRGTKHAERLDFTASPRQAPAGRGHSLPGLLGQREDGVKFMVASAGQHGGRARERPLA